VFARRDFVLMQRKNRGKGLGMEIRKQ